MGTETPLALLYLLAVCALVGGLAVAAPRTEAAQNPTQLPPGTYTTTITGQDAPGFPQILGDWQITFTNAGHFTGVYNGKEVVTGRYTVQQDQLTLTDETGPYAETGTEASGTYKWTFDGKALTLTSVNDSNAGRRTVLTAHPMQLKSATAPLPATGGDTDASMGELFVLAALGVALLSIGLAVHRRRS